LNLSYFISKRIRLAEAGSFSSIIHKVAVGSITIGLAAAIVSFLVMRGFQSGVKEKVYGFSNHLLITKFTMNNAVAEQPFSYNIDLFQHPEKFPFVKHVQEFSHKPGLIKTENEVMGIVFKGVSKNFNRLAFEENLVEGKFLSFPDSGYSHEIVISRVIANKLNKKGVRLSDAERKKVGRRKARRGCAVQANVRTIQSPANSPAIDSDTDAAT